MASRRTIPLNRVSRVGMSSAHDLRSGSMMRNKLQKEAWMVRHSAKSIENPVRLIKHVK